MTDRLTQLQDAVNLQAENLCNAIGVLQSHAPPSSFPDFERPTQPKPETTVPKAQTEETPANYPQLFAQLIVKTAKDIDVLIDSLPNEDSTPELQAASLRRLEMDNTHEAIKIEEAVNKCENMIDEIRLILRKIALHKLHS